MCERLGKNASTLVEKLKEMAGARDAQVEVTDVNHGVVRFHTQRYDIVSVRVGVENDRPQAEKEVTVLAKGAIQMEASLRWTEFDLECSATLTAPEGLVIEISKQGIRSASRWGDSINLDSPYLAGSHLLALSEAIADARSTMPGGRQPTTWDVVCKELKGS